MRHVLGDWILDRVARRPSGRLGRALQRDPRGHEEGFGIALGILALELDDRLLDLACGGGALLTSALASGCHAVGVDHSADMLRETTRRNATAVREGRLSVTRADAARLPFPDGDFTAAVSANAFFFFPEPDLVLGELRRVLDPACGRVVVVTSAPEVNQTALAAPAFAARRMRFHPDDELRDMALRAGFTRARVTRHGPQNQVLIARAS